MNRPAYNLQVLTCSTLDELAGLQLHCKAEIFQRTGAFKFRGASNAVFGLPDDAALRGVVTHSSGNHGAAVALAAKLRGIPAFVVVPSNTPAVKRAAIRSYGVRGSDCRVHVLAGTVAARCLPQLEPCHCRAGVEPTVCEASIDAREAACAAIQAETGATFIAPYNDCHVMAGQGTIALEFLQQVPQLDAIVVPISGGGMISGIAVTAKALKPSIKIIAAEPTGRNDAADVAASKAAGRLVQVRGAPHRVAGF